MVWFVERILPALALMNRSPEREELIHLARELRDLDTPRSGSSRR